MKKTFRSFQDLRQIVNTSHADHYDVAVKKSNNLVYSTELGGKVKQAKESASAQTQNLSSVKILKIRKGRGGKTVTLVKGLNISPENMKEFRKMLQEKIQTGGTIKDYCIELQGDHGETVLKFLDEKGISAKIS